MRTNPVNLLDELSPNFTIRQFDGEFHCPECENDEIKVSYDEIKDGDLCLTDILDAALLDNGWCDSLGVCPSCRDAFAQSDADERKAS